MKVKLSFFLVFFSALQFWSCDKRCSDCLPAGDYSSGIFVVNEGASGGGGTISWYNPNTGEVRDSIYEKANGGGHLGQYVQSLAFYNGKGYIVVSGANRIVVVDGDTFRFIDTIGGFHIPRYFQPVSQSVAFVSQWGDDGISGSLAKIDLDFNKITKTIPVGNGPEKMLYFSQNHQLFVANSGGYGVDSTVAYFQVDLDDAVQKKIIAGQRNPACLSSNSQGGFAPWNVLCKGDWMDAAAKGWVGRSFSGTSAGTQVPAFSDDLSTGPDGLDYFTSGSAIYKVKADGTVEKLFDQPAYGFTVDALGGQLYCADARDFNSAGEVVIRKPDGAMVGTFRAGIAPGEIVIKY